MTKLHDHSFSLTGKQRGYRVPGAKLKPRDAYDASRSDQQGVTSRQLRKDDAIEARVMGYFHPARLTRPERRIERLKRQLSTRAYKRVVATVNAAEVGGVGSCIVYIHGANRQRLSNALRDHVQLQYAIEWDRKTLANAY